MSPPESVLEYRVTSLENSTLEMRTAISSIDKSLQILARIESKNDEIICRQDRLERSIELQGARIGELEQKEQLNKLVRSWVLRAVLGVLGVVGAGVIALVIK